MMKLRYLFENFDLARMALNAYPHDEQTLDAYLRHFRISSNAVYPYANQGKRCFLRLAPIEEKRLELAEAEIEYIRYLRTRGYSAMRPIPDQSGKYASLLESPWGTYCVSAFEGVSGRPVENVVLSHECLFEMGRSLGQLHMLSRQYQPNLRRPSHQQILQDVRQLLADNHAPVKMVEKLDELSEALSRLPVNEENYGLLHYDFEPDNVFWDEKTHTCSVIDFDDSIYGWYALDVEQALDALSELVKDDDASVFLHGYRSVSAYTAEMEDQQPLMRRFIQLRGYARLLHCLSDEIADPPEWMTEMCKKLSAAKRRLEESILHS